jgi:hypothetical protein
MRLTLAMNYESFRSVFEEALSDSGLPVFGVGREELLDVRSLDRIFRMVVEPVGGQQADPFLSPPRCPGDGERLRPPERIRPSMTS